MHITQPLAQPLSTPLAWHASLRAHVACATHSLAALGEAGPSLQSTQDAVGEQHGGAEAADPLLVRWVVAEAGLQQDS
jgi:hypothetical protein